MTADHAVSFLFVPGSRPDRFAKAIAAAPDRVIIDLEDAVDPPEKARARADLVSAIAAGLDAPVLVRINASDSPWFEDDLAMLAEIAHTHLGSLAGVVIAKLESVDAVARVRDTLPPGAEIIGLIESAAGVAALEELARSGLTRIAIGAIDLSVDLGSEVQSPVLDFVYARTVIASRLAGIAAPIASPPIDLHAETETETDARRLAAMGVSGQLCIHPAQLGAVHRGFAPTREQIEWAERVAASVGASVQVDGGMVDKPVRDRAAHILQAAERRQA